jgi:hypothetical protein
LLNGYHLSQSHIWLLTSWLYLWSFSETCDPSSVRIKKIRHRTIGNDIEKTELAVNL